MKIFVNQIPPEGLTLTEKISAGTLDLDTRMCELAAPVDAAAQVERGINFISVRLSLRGQAKVTCSRCLAELRIDFERHPVFHIPLDKMQNVVDLTDDIREGIMLDFPIKPLCKPDCAGLCPVCGASLNEKKCDCNQK